MNQSCKLPAQPKLMIQSYVPQDKWSHHHWPAVNSSAAPPSRGPCPQCIRFNPEKDINSDTNRPIPCPLNSLNCTLSSAGHMMHQRLPLLDPQYTTRPCCCPHLLFGLSSRIFLFFLFNTRPPLLVMIMSTRPSALSPIYHWYQRYPFALLSSVPDRPG